MTPVELQRRKAQAEGKEVRGVIDREFSVSLMNNTKWSELANALAGLPLGYRIKWVDVAEPKPLGGFWAATDRHFDSSFGPFLTLSIEWLDINPKVSIFQGTLLEPKTEDLTEDVEARLRAVQVPFHREGVYIRVTGHIRHSNGGQDSLDP